MVILVSVVAGTYLLVQVVDQERSKLLTFKVKTIVAYFYSSKKERIEMKEKNRL